MARKILGIAGSLRRDSYNKAVLRTLAELSWEGVGIRTENIRLIQCRN
jgi:NAD(P)H-dependent FMN reductase